MVFARVASLASQSQLWSLWSWLWSLRLSQQPSCASEAAVFPSLVLTLPIMLIGGCMVLQEVELSQITNVLSYLCVFSSVVQVDVVQSRSAFQVLFKSLKNKLSSFICNMLWQMVSEEV